MHSNTPGDEQQQKLAATWLLAAGSLAPLVYVRHHDACMTCKLAWTVLPLLAAASPTVLAGQAPKDGSWSKFVTIQGWDYDITHFAAKHPGGSVISFLAGQDATAAFTEFHRCVRRRQRSTTIVEHALKVCVRLTRVSSTRCRPGDF